MYCGDKKVEWSCLKKVEKSKMSENDLSFYNSIRKDLDYKYQILVFKTISKYLNRFDNFSNTKKQKINDLLIKKLDKKISNFIDKFPQDISLTKIKNNKYLTLELLRFELMKLDFEKGNIISWNQALKIAKI